MPRKERTAQARELRIDADEALDFLAAITHPNTFGNVTAIDPETSVCIGCGFKADGGAAEKVEAFLLKNQHRNLYWTVNLPNRIVNKKPMKADIGWMRYAHLDLDDPSPAALKRIRSASLPPTLIIFSGGGYGAFWKLAQPAKITSQNLNTLEALNKHLLEIFAAGAGTWNIDRLMRLPATVNWLSRKKRQEGRKPAATYLIEHHPERAYTTAQLASISCRIAPTASPRRRASKGFGAVVPFDESPEPQTLLEKLYARRAAQAAASAPHLTDKSRSGNLWSLVGYYIAMGWNDAYIHTKCTGHPHAISQKNPTRAIQRCIDRQRAKRAEAERFAQSQRR